MIITRTPFRMSFAGGGSDIPSFYKKNGGCVVSTSINKYMYISIHPSFDRKETVLKYSQTESVRDVGDIEHKYFRKILELFDISGIEIVSTADVPSGTGLGSSSSFTVGVLHTLYAYMGKYVSKERLASEACDIEISKLGNPIGKQDQYAAAYGGLNYIEFHQNGDVCVSPIMMSEDAKKRLEDNLMVFYTGQVHSASEILERQSRNAEQADIIKSQLKMCDLAKELRDELQKDNVDAVGEILHKNWVLKKTLANGISNPEIDEYYNRATNSGALGGKLLGAGGGGFLVFYVDKKDQDRVRKSVGLPQMSMLFDRQGSTVIYVGDKPDFL